MKKVYAVQKLNEQELKLGMAGGAGSWHEKYAHSAVVYVGGLPLEITEGDVLAVFEQVGRVIHINLVRDDETGKPRGFCFLEYKDQRSSILAVDNFNGVDLYDRILSVDHVEEYKQPDPEKVPLLDLGEDDEGSPRDASPSRSRATEVSVRAGGEGDAMRKQAALDRLQAIRRRRALEEEAIVAESNGVRSRDGERRPKRERTDTSVADPQPTQPVHNSARTASANSVERVANHADPANLTVRNSPMDQESRERTRRKTERREERQRIREARADRRRERHASRRDH